MPAAASPPSSALRIGALGAIALLVVLAALVALLAGLIRQRACAGTSSNASPSARAEQGIPAAYLILYRQAGVRYRVPWPVLAGIGEIETDHGRSRAPGVSAGVNSYGCCAGPMQFNLRNGPPSTWERYGVDGDHDGTKDVYDPADAIPSAANYLRVLLRNAGGNISQAILGYNHSQAYVNDVLARARVYGGLAEAEFPARVDVATIGCAEGGLDVLVGPANLQAAQSVSSPRAFRSLPAWAMAGGRAPHLVDARIHANVIWILRRYHLRVTAAREGGHQTHGDGTAVDLVPADGTTQAVWDASAGRLAQDLGWSAACARSGTRPSCRLAPAIQFVGYDGYLGHGSPRTCRGGCPAHLHISWVSPCYGTSGLSPPCPRVMSFPAPAGETAPSV